jgi:branched-chain amino acid transport system substrate-binding protein
MRMVGRAGPVAALAVALIVLSMAVRAADPFVVGIEAGMTGPQAGVLAPVVDVIKIYVDHVNAQGGVKAHPIRLIIEDDQAQPSRAAANIVKLTRQDHVQLIIETSLSTTFGPVMAQATRANVPVLFSGAACPPQSFPPAKPLIYCTTSFDQIRDVPIAIQAMHLLAKNKSSFAFVSWATPFARSVADSAKEAGNRLGMKLLDTEFLPPTTSDYTPFATKINGFSPDWSMAYAPWLIETQTFAALRGLGWNGIYLASGALSAEDDLPHIADTNFLVITSSAMFADDPPVKKEIYDVLAAGKYTYPMTYAGEGWVGAMALAQILAKASWPATTDSLVESMNSLNLDTNGLRGAPIVWTPENHFRTKTCDRLYHWDPATKKIQHLIDWQCVDVKP